MNAYQAAYANALAIMEVEQEKRDTYEVSFFKGRRLTRREAYVRDDVMDEYDNDSTAKALAYAYYDAVDLYVKASNNLIAWGLSLMPDGLRKDMEQAANRPKYRERLINILMRLDTKCGDTVIKKQLSMFAKSA